MRLYLTVILSFFYINYTFAKEKNIKDNFVMTVGKSKCIAEKKILEVTSFNTAILKIQKDYFSNKICLKAIKAGYAKVFLLLSDGRKRIEMKISVIQKKESYLDKKNKKNIINKKFTSFDKDIKNNYILDGWKE